jgi:hypothetical protein
MFSRMFFAAVGVGTGVAVGIWAIRKLERTRRQLAPDALVARAGERASGLGARMSYALEAGRQAAEAKEAELRTAFMGERASGREPAGGDRWERASGGDDDAIG